MQTYLLFDVECPYCTRLARNKILIVHTLLLSLTILLFFAGSAQARDPIPQHQAFTHSLYLPAIETSNTSVFFLAENYEKLRHEFGFSGVQLPDVVPEPAIEAGQYVGQSQWIFNCAKGKGAYAVFRVASGTFIAFFGIHPGITAGMVSGNCPATTCMGGHYLGGEANTYINDHRVGATIDASHVFGGCTP